MIVLEGPDLVIEEFEEKFGKQQVEKNIIAILIEDQFANLKTFKTMDLFIKMDQFKARVFLFQNFLICYFKCLQ